VRLVLAIHTPRKREVGVGKTEKIPIREKREAGRERREQVAFLDQARLKNQGEGGGLGKGAYKRAEEGKVLLSTWEFRKGGGRKTEAGIKNARC